MTRYIEIRYGRDFKMYTLWNVLISDNGYSETFIKNLSTDYNKAIKKAEEFGKGIVEISIDAPEDLNDIVRGDDVFRFGKYRDKRVSQVSDIKYLKWVFDGCKLPDKEDGKWYPTKASNDPIVVKVKEHLLSIGDAVLYNDKIISHEHYNAIMKWTEKAVKSDFFGKVGERITLENVTVDSIKYVDIDYSMYSSGMFIITFIDSNNNIFVTKRSGSLLKPQISKCLFTDKNIDKKDWKNLIQIGVTNDRMHTVYSGYNLTNDDYDELNSIDFSLYPNANYYNKKTKTVHFIESTPYEELILKMGDVVTIKGTIKEHTTYKDAKQTILNRVTIE